MKPHIHAESSAKLFGGKPADYIDIHRFMDSSKGVVADHRHRALTHNTWFIKTVLTRVFGYSILNSDNTEVSVEDIGEQHVREDYRGRFIPSAQDFLERMEYCDWMNNGNSGLPSSAFPLEEVKTEEKPTPTPVENLGKIRELLENERTLDGSKIHQPIVVPFKDDEFGWPGTPRLID